LKLNDSKIVDLEHLNNQLCTDIVHIKTSLVGALGEVDLLKTNLNLSAVQLLQTEEERDQFKTSLAVAQADVHLLKTNLKLSEVQMLQTEKLDELKLHVQQLEDDKIEWKNERTRLAKHIEELNGENIVLKNKGDRLQDELIRVRHPLIKTLTDQAKEAKQDFNDARTGQPDKESLQSKSSTIYI